VLMLLERHIKIRNLNANESQNGGHLQNSNPNPSIELEPRTQECGAAKPEPTPQPRRLPDGTYPLGMVLDACPDVAARVRDKKRRWLLARIDPQSRGGRIQSRADADGAHRQAKQ
jgi:replication initiation protein RepC